jgi:hypothetical protein
MIERYLQIETLSVVFLGDFNPIIFQPSWLALKNLIREDEANNAKIEVIHNEIVKYELNDWLTLEITKNRCQFKTSKVPYFEPMKDLIIGIFTILRETPIYSFGINHIYDLSLVNADRYYEFGAKLTPLSVWNDVFSDPRLLSLEINETERKDGEKGSRRIRISSTDQKIPFGVTVNFNNHFNLRYDDKKIDAIKILTSNWPLSFNQANDIIQNIYNKIIA